MGMGYHLIQSIVIFGQNNGKMFFQYDAIGSLKNQVWWIATRILGLYNHNGSACDGKRHSHPHKYNNIC